MLDQNEEVKSREELQSRAAQVIQEVENAKPLPQWFLDVGPLAEELGVIIHMLLDPNSYISTEAEFDMYISKYVRTREELLKLIP